MNVGIEFILNSLDDDTIFCRRIPFSGESIACLYYMAKCGKESFRRSSSLRSFKTKSCSIRFESAAFAVKKTQPLRQGSKRMTNTSIANA